MEAELINRVSNSQLITINLEELYTEGERVVFDIKDCLFMGLILKEKDFREFVKNHDWASYQGKFVAITCSADAIVPTWAYMLVASRLEPYAADFVFGNAEVLETALYLRKLADFNIEEYRGKKVVVKGCSNKPVPVSAYVELTRKLSGVVQSVMYGEPCSTVPILKKK